MKRCFMLSEFIECDAHVKVGKASELIGVMRTRVCGDERFLEAFDSCWEVVEGCFERANSVVDELD